LTSSVGPGSSVVFLWQRFRDAIEPLKRGGKLGAVLFQFAPWVAFHPKNREHIDECQRRVDGYQLAVEFRNKSWFEGKHAAMTLDFERERGLVNVIVDEPNTSANSIPSVWEVTVPRLAIVRLHGRNDETWNIKGDAASQRFNYDYSERELEGFAIVRFAAQAVISSFPMNWNYRPEADIWTCSGKLSFGPAARPEAPHRASTFASIDWPRAAGYGRRDVSFTAPWPQR
jgi:hypothetical protein